MSSGVGGVCCFRCCAVCVLSLCVFFISLCLWVLCLLWLLLQCVLRVSLRVACSGCVGLCVVLSMQGVVGVVSCDV